MNRLIFSLLVILVPVLVMAQNQQSKVIDGLSDDWTSEFSPINKDGKITYSVNKDDSNLYICFQTADRAIQQKMIRSGTVLQLSAKGKRKFKASISYPLKSDIADQRNTQQARPNLQAGQIPDRSMALDRRRTMLGALVNMKTRGFESANGTMNHSISDIKTSINWDGELMLCYEIQIPLKELYGDDFSETDLLNPIQLKLTASAISSPQSGMGGQNMASGGRSGRSGGGGGRSGRGGGMPTDGGTRSGGAGGQMSEMTVSSVYRAEILLNNLK